jgi:hypothetical protein
VALVTIAEGATRVEEVLLASKPSPCVVMAVAVV